jgi:hypothetical protein
MEPDWRSQTGEEGPDARAQTAGAGVAPPATATSILIPFGIAEGPKHHCWYVSEAPLTAAETRVLTQGVGSPLTVADCTDIRFFTWSIRTSHACTLQIKGSIDYALTTPYGLITQTVAAGVLATPYDLASPYNRNGYLIIGGPFLSIQVIDTSGLDHTYGRMYFHLW